MTLVLLLGMMDPSLMSFFETVFDNGGIWNDDTTLKHKQVNTMVFIPNIIISAFRFRFNIRTPNGERYFCAFSKEVSREERNLQCVSVLV